jgi:hypothetical protein
MINLRKLNCRRADLRLHILQCHHFAVASLNFDHWIVLSHMKDYEIRNGSPVWKI